jgi:hypothetical protein
MYVYIHIFIYTYIGGNDAVSLKKEIAGLKVRLEKMEKISLLSANGRYKKRFICVYMYVCIYIFI